MHFPVATPRRAASMRPDEVGGADVLSFDLVGTMAGLEAALECRDEQG